ncbi:MAG: CHASE2 domain-containing protein [Pseudomonadota bacterium]|nr:CHASE2 domain-containing protein [Pseudomonadota bacterium]
MGQESFRSDGQQKEFKVARLKPVWWGVINVALAAIILLIEPDSIGDAVDEYSYAVFSQTVGAPLYPASRVDDIGVILLDDESLAGLKSSWPAVYGLHAKVLRKLLTAKPKALFIDFTFRDRRAAAPQGVLADEWMPELYVHDDSLTMLVSTLQMYQMMDIPVYLQAGALNFYQHHAVLSELAPYVTLVSGWGDLRGQADIRALSYQLAPELRNAGRVANLQDDDLPLCDDAVMRRTGNGNLLGCDVSGITAAATTIYQHFCSGKERAKSIRRGWNCDQALIMPSKTDKSEWLAWREDLLVRPMWLSWPDRQADYSAWTKAYDQSGNVIPPYECGPQYSDPNAAKRITGNLATLFGIGARADVNCAPFHTISAEQVYRDTPSAGRWVENFKDRIVMYGQNLQGFQDVVRPPTLDTDIPGVFLHAMALENLLSNGSAYLSDKATYSSWLTADLIEIMTLAIIVFLRFGLAGLARRSFPALPHASNAQDRECNPLEYFGLILANKLSMFLSMMKFVPKIPKLLRVWSGNRNAEHHWTEQLDLRDRQLARNWFMVLICLLDLVLSVAIVTFGAIVLELSVLSIAPVNWLAVIGLGMLSYIPFVRSLFAQDNELAEGAEHDRQENSAEAIEKSATV